MKVFLLAVILCIVALSRSAHAEDHVAIETDAAAYALDGYSVILRITRATGLDVAVGTGRYRLPSLFLSGQQDDDAADWRATAEAIQVARVGYRWCGAHHRGPAADLIVLNQLWHVEARRTGEDTHFKTLGVGLSGGYYVPIGRHVYVYPNAAVTIDTAYGGSRTAGAFTYDVNRVGYAGSIHIGWEL